MMTKPTTDCDNRGLCYYDSSRRPRFFHGMLLTDEHLQAEQKYHRDALRRINRYLWGEGIVCGLEVENTNGLCIKIHPGLALDCHGNVIEVCKPLTIDLWSECRKLQPKGCDSNTDIPEFDRHLVIKYVEIEDDPEPVFTPADDCTPAGQACQKSRVREGFCLELREKCRDDPAATQTTPPRFEECFHRTPVCPPCACDCGCGDCWIGLATLTINCTTRAVKVTCNCRDYAHSPKRLEEDAERQFLTVRRDVAMVFREVHDLANLIKYRTDDIPSQFDRTDASVADLARVQREDAERLTRYQMEYRDALGRQDQKHEEAAARHADAVKRIDKVAVGKWDSAADAHVKKVIEQSYVNDLKKQIAALTKQVETLQKAIKP